MKICRGRGGWRGRGGGRGFGDVDFRERSGPPGGGAPGSGGYRDYRRDRSPPGSPPTRYFDEGGRPRRVAPPPPPPRRSSSRSPSPFNKRGRDRSRSRSREESRHRDSRDAILQCRYKTEWICCLFGGRLRMMSALGGGGVPQKAKANDSTVKLCECDSDNGGGVKKSENFADVIRRCPLIKLSC